MATADAIVYVDGFNLYYGSLKRTPYKWLDLGRLCAEMLPPIASSRSSTTPLA